MMGRRVLALVLTVAVASVNTLTATAGTADGEVVVDVRRLTAVVRDAGKPIQERMKSTQLKEKFEAVNKLLKQEDVDKRKLVAALRDLQTELDKFCENWQQVVSPLWAGQEAVAATIEKVRLMLARCKTGEPTKETKKVLANYDARLKNLARAIKAEKSKTRRRQMLLMFKNVLALRKLVARFGGLNLGNVTEAVYVKTLRALVALETQFALATFQVEKARVVLSAQSSFIKQYVGIMEGVIRAEELAKLLADMRKAKNGLGPISVDLGGLGEDAERFRKNMTDVMGRIATGIEKHTDKMGAGADSGDLDDVNVNKALERYAQ